MLGFCPDLPQKEMLAMNHYKKVTIQRSDDCFHLSYFNLIMFLMCYVKAWIMMLKDMGLDASIVFDLYERRSTSIKQQSKHMNEDCFNTCRFGPVNLEIINVKNDFLIEDYLGQII